MLRWRLLLGAAVIGVLVGLCWLDSTVGPPGMWLFPPALVVGLLASGEILWLCSARDVRPLGWVIYVGNASIVAANWATPLLGDASPLGAFGWPAAALAGGTALAFLGEIGRYAGPGAVTQRLGLAVLSLVYVGLLLSFVIQLRFLDLDRGQFAGDWGIAALASLVIVVKMCDTGAYTIGRLLGRHRMAPLVSPGKTIEGAVGGVAFALAGSWATFHLLVPAIVAPGDRSSPWWGWILFGVLVGIAGMVGDLAESLLKRDLGRKHSSSWLPGFGGVLDLVDSILLAAPAAYLCWALGLVGP